MVRIDKELLEVKVNSNQIKTHFKTSWAKVLIFLAAFKVSINFHSKHQNSFMKICIKFFDFKNAFKFLFIVKRNQIIIYF
jgi:hypothetical protein